MPGFRPEFALAASAVHLATRTASATVLVWVKPSNARSSVLGFFEKHPFCCYCGGAEKATTIDHVPAKIMFPNKHRPAGLEVPSCSPCNRGTSKFDQMAGVSAASLRWTRCKQTGRNSRSSLRTCTVTFPIGAQRWPATLDLTKMNCGRFTARTETRSRESL